LAGGRVLTGAAVRALSQRSDRRGASAAARVSWRLYRPAAHPLCTTDGNGLTDTRTTLTNGLMRLLIWTMPFDTEPRLAPSIPFHRLPDAPGAMRARPGGLQRGCARRNGVVRTPRP
jgi:hypothetical protein